MVPCLQPPLLPLLFNVATHWAGTKQADIQWGFAWHPVAAATPTGNSHLWGRKWSAAQRAQLQPTLSTFRCLQQQGKLRLLRAWSHISGYKHRHWKKYWTKFFFLLQVEEATCAVALSSNEMAMIWWQLLAKPIDLEWKVLLPFSTAKPQSVSCMRHPLFFYVIISVTLQYETFSIQSLCVGGCEYFQLIVMNALAQAAAAGRGLRAPLSKPSSDMLLTAPQR